MFESSTKYFSVILDSVVKHEVHVVRLLLEQVLQGKSHSKDGTNPELISSILYVLELDT